MLGKVFARFVEKSPISVMVRGTLERVLGADQLDAWFARTAQKQYTRTVLFSTVYDVLSQVVFRIKPSVRAAYRDQEDKVGASLISLYNKLNGVETHTSAELVRYSAAVLTPLIEQLDGARGSWLPGYRVKIIDGNCIEASERRLKALREVGSWRATEQETGVSQRSASQHSSFLRNKAASGGMGISLFAKVSCKSRNFRGNCYK